MRILPIRGHSSRLVSNISGDKMMMWKRVVPASTRILDFLGQELMTPEARIDSCLQLLRFYTHRRDLAGAEVITLPTVFKLLHKGGEV